MPTGGGDLGFVASHIDGLAGDANAGGGLEGDAYPEVLAAGDAPQGAAGVIGQKSPGRDLVPVLGAFLLHNLEAVADLHGLDRVDAHHGLGDVGVQAVENRLPQARWHIDRHHIHPSAYGIAGLAQGVQAGLQFRDLGGVPAEKRVVVHLVPVLQRRAHRA